jgi:hypothetical protein
MMTQRRHFERFLALISVFLVLGSALVLSLVKLDDYDIWWHLKCGEIFLSEKKILRSEIFSYTAYGAPWVNGYLLAQVFFYLIFRLGGYEGPR